MALEKWRGKTALVTGASAGIGEQMARQLAAAGVDLVVTARREDRLRALAEELSGEHGVEVRYVSADLGAPAGATGILDFVRAQGVQVELLVNNAGFGGAGVFNGSPLEKQLGMVQVNITSLVALTHGLLPGMIARGSGSVLLVGSVNAFMPVPYFAVYSATKAFVRSFGEALAVECRGTGVSVTALHPGATATEFIEVADMKVGRAIELGFMKPSAVARVGLLASHAGRVSVVAGLMNKLAVFMLWLMPQRIIRNVVKQVFKRLS